MRLVNNESLRFKWRFEVLERDEFTCQYCGAAPRKNPEVKLHVDHIHPRKLGGSDKPENLITACQTCNLGKSAQFYPNIFKLDFPTMSKKIHSDY